ncbi:MAG TPA: phosphoribosylformylglycinamidine cyclo-ligase [Candidatus Limnocylindria bacterium]|jgi:phosphoribosylformylglycinamidine cyclo-ligase|nr:phosphoribosylformylglycinamidine cyclo-ligase [Candidatus Limnocylindria bacterium]
MSRSYREAGVDVDEARRAVELIGRAAASTATTAVLGGVGGFGSLFRFDPAPYPDPVLVASTDGVGTKLKIAIALGRHGSIGIDLVNHCINDIAVQGADPLFFLDYLATGRLRAEVAGEVVRGVADACAAAGVALVGGETAEMPDVYDGEDYDLAGFIVGAVARRDVVDGRDVRAGDALIGLPSSGLHTNGYSLVRRVLSESEWRKPAGDGERTLGDVLLEPHRSYLDDIRLLRRALREAGGDTLAFAHITGGGWLDNIPRTLPAGLGVEVETGSWRVPWIFSLLQERGDIADDEMVRTFNLGIGLTVVVHPEQAELALTTLPDAVRVGTVVPVEADAPRVAFL